MTADVFADVLTQETCPTATIGVTASVLNLIRVCACISVLELGDNQEVCECPLANSSPICARGRCACQCDEGFVSVSFSKFDEEQRNEEAHLLLSVPRTPPLVPVSTRTLAVTLEERSSPTTMVRSFARALALSR